MLVAIRISSVVREEPRTETTFALFNLQSRLALLLILPDFSLGASHLLDDTSKNWLFLNIPRNRWWLSRPSDEPLAVLKSQGFV